MRNFIGTKTVLATPMALGDYNNYRGWVIPADENPEDAGYLVEYTDGGKPNHADHKGYVSWSPADVFERSYKLAETFVDRMNVELDELEARMDKLADFVERSPIFGTLATEDQTLMCGQLGAMTAYYSILVSRRDRALQLALPL